jgi:LAO/AO transport system kinase
LLPKCVRLRFWTLNLEEIFVVNNADRGGADKTVREIEDMLFKNAKPDRTRIPTVLKTQAIHGDGIAGLLEEIQNHRSFLLKERHKHLIEERIRQKFVDS